MTQRRARPGAARGHGFPWLARLALGLGVLAGATDARADEVEACASAAEEGQARRDQGELLASRERLVRCAQSSCPEVIRKDCATWLAEVDGRIPTIVLKVVDDRGDDVASVRVSRGGETWQDAVLGKAMPIDPGPLSLRVEATGYDAGTKDVVVAEGERGRIVELVLRRSGGGPAKVPAETEAPPASIGGGPGALPWIFLGVGAAGMATFGVLQIVAQGEISDIEAGCGATQTCTDDDLDPTRGKLVGSAIGLGFGIAGLGAAALTFVLASGDDGSAALTVRPTGGPASAGLSFGGPL